ncbi:MAG: hypothetical protein DMF60_00770, partial [Acidobacteria bacterium]
GAMNEFERFLQAGWKPIPSDRIGDLCDEFCPVEKQARLLGRLFQSRGLDITKPYRKAYEYEHEAWFFVQHRDGELITLENLRIHTQIS